jgi:hypothetical protein
MASAKKKAKAAAKRHAQKARRKGNAARGGKSNAWRAYVGGGKGGGTNWSDVPD